MKAYIILLALTLSTSAITCVLDSNNGFAQKNSLNIPVGHKSAGGLSQEEFYQVISEVSSVYEPIIKANGDKLVVNRAWSNGSVNAMTTRSRRRVMVSMFGGLARHKLMTKDGFATVLCHEFGHHFGGAPKRKARFGSTSWASNEGQSDYFANLRCFKRVYGSDDNVSIIQNLDIPKIVQDKCREVYKNENEAALCMRSVFAAKAATDILGEIMQTGITDFNKPDTSIIEETTHLYPHSQCRLDTYFAASLCDKDINIDLDNKDATQGTCSRRNKDLIGSRPLCWFKPQN